MPSFLRKISWPWSAYGRGGGPLSSLGDLEKKIGKKMRISNAWLLAAGELALCLK